MNKMEETPRKKNEIYLFFSKFEVRVVSAAEEFVIVNDQGIYITTFIIGARESHGSEKTWCATYRLKN